MSSFFAGAECLEEPVKSLLTKSVLGCVQIINIAEIKREKGCVE
jgi:hypothetical protein